MTSLNGCTVPALRFMHQHHDQQQTVREPLIRNTERNAPLYRLIFASKHSLGNKIWNEVTKKNYYGQQNLL